MTPRIAVEYNLNLVTGHDVAGWRFSDPPTGAEAESKPRAKTRGENTEPCLATTISTVIGLAEGKTRWRGGTDIGSAAKRGAMLRHPPLKYPPHFSSAQKRQPLEQMKILLVLQGRAVQRRGRLARIALAQHLGRAVAVGLIAGLRFLIAAVFLRVQVSGLRSKKRHTAVAKQIPE